MKLLKDSKRVHIFITLVAALIFLLINIVQAAVAQPGTEGDPVVSKSYVDEEISKLNAKIQELEAKLEKQSASKFEVVELKSGQKLIAGESTEIIVRAGKTLAISGKYGDGLSDLTTDEADKGNLAADQIVPLNHLLLAARDDGRGIKAVSSKVYVLVKGEYDIK